MGRGGTGRLTVTLTAFSPSDGESWVFYLRNANRQTNNLQFSGKQSREGTFTGTSVEVVCKLL